MSVDRILDTLDDLDIDALMAHVREAAGVVVSAAPAAPPAGETTPAAESDLAQALAAQAAWSERMMRSLALIVECLDGLQDALQAIEHRTSSAPDRTTSAVSRRPRRRQTIRRARGRGRSK